MTSGRSTRQLPDLTAAANSSLLIFDRPGMSSSWAILYSSARDCPAIAA